MTMRVVSLIAALAIASVALGQTGQSPKRPWTVLVYGAADNNADGAILEFLDDVRKAVDDDPGLDLLLFIDRSEKYNKDVQLVGERFTGARLYRLRKGSVERLGGGEQFPELTLESDPEIDSADAANIGRFIAWGKATSPAERYALLIYSHANGRTMCPDEQSKRDMGIAELTDKVGPEGHVDFLALELCNMSGIEIAYQWRPGNGRFSADVLLAIPNAGPPLDWNFGFERIRSRGRITPASRPPVDPAKMTAADFGALVIEEGREGRLLAAQRGQEGAFEAAACCDLRAVGAVKESIDQLARALDRSSAKSAFMAVRGPGPNGATMNYSRGGPYVDLYALSQRAAASDALSKEVRDAAAAVAEHTDRFVTASFGMDGYEGFEAGKNGVFIVLPANTGNPWKHYKWYTTQPGEGRDYGRWSFLRDGATPGNGVVENWFELLDSWFDEPGESGGLNGCRP